MKTILLFLILFSVMAMPALGELTEADLNEIRLIVNDAEKRIKEEVKTETTITHTKIDGLDTRLRNVETNIAELRGRNIGFSVLKDWLVVICAAAAIIISIIALRKKEPAISPTTQDTQKAVPQ